MEAVESEIQKYFAPPGGELPQDVLIELRSIMRLHSLSAQDLFYKWESYSIKLGIENAKLDQKVARDLRRDIQDALERETRSRVHPRGTDKRGPTATPRAAKGGETDVFGMMDGISHQKTPRLPMSGVNGNSVKRRSSFDIPSAKAGKPHPGSSPGEGRTFDNSGPGPDITGHRIPFPDRKASGEIVQSLNGHIEMIEPPPTACTEPRIRVKANTDLSKFSYKTMAMKLSEASEILDDRMDEILALVQKHHGLDDDAFGNPASQSPSEIVAVGRIASDTSEGKLNTASMVLETSRRTGAGLRVPLKLDDLPGFDFFPGKLVALRGTNASGEYFKAIEILEIPLLGHAASSVPDLDEIHKRLAATSSDSEEPTRPLNILASAGPYTSDDNLDFEPLHALCEQATNTNADALILAGPFLDIEHPLVAAGDFPPLPSSLCSVPDTSTLKDVFRALVSVPLHRLSQSLPAATIILVPSVRDAVSKHVSWPQDRMARKELGVPKQCMILTNPVTFSLNEIVIAISTNDILYGLKREQCVGGVQRDITQNPLARVSRHMIEQRHFYPLFPPTPRENIPKPSAVEHFDHGAGDEEKNPMATGAMLDTSYLALGEWQNVRPDILITPSSLPQFANVVDSVLVINPGTLSKKKGSGTFARFYINPAEISEEDREEQRRREKESLEPKMVAHGIFERAKVDIIKI